MMPHSLGFGIDAAVVPKVKSTTVALPTRSVNCSSLHYSMLERRESRFGALATIAWIHLVGLLIVTKGPLLGETEPCRVAWTHQASLGGDGTCSSSTAWPSLQAVCLAIQCMS